MSTVTTPFFSLEPFDITLAGEFKGKEMFLFPTSGNLTNDGDIPLIMDTSGGYSYQGVVVISRNDGAAMVIPQRILGDIYFAAFRKQVVPVFNKAIGNLLNIRNHLLLQLDLECGNITDKYFDGVSYK